MCAFQVPSIMCAGATRQRCHTRAFMPACCYTTIKSSVCQPSWCPTLRQFQAMTKNKEMLKAALEPLKTKLTSSSFLTSDTLTLADVLYMADLRPAFEKVSSLSCVPGACAMVLVLLPSGRLLCTVTSEITHIGVQVLDPNDRKSLPELTAWYERCYSSSKAVQAVWKGSLTLCEESVLDVKVRLVLTACALLTGQCIASKPETGVIPTCPLQCELNTIPGHNSQKGCAACSYQNRVAVQVKESKEEKKAREKARKKEKDAAKKAAPPPAGTPPAVSAQLISLNLGLLLFPEFGTFLHHVLSTTRVPASREQTCAESRSGYSSPAAFSTRPCSSSVEVFR